MVSIRVSFNGFFFVWIQQNFGYVPIFYSPVNFIMEFVGFTLGEIKRICYNDGKYRFFFFFYFYLLLVFDHIILDFRFR